MSELKRSLEQDDQASEVKKVKKLRNRKYALMFCYYGHNYYGLQRNEPFKTIEGEFLKTLFNMKIIDQERFEKPNLMRFQRAARTDKGVSAVRQVISCMFTEDFPDKVKEINAALPDEIRLVTARRTVPSFDARNFVDCRTYSYTFPTFTISPPKTVLSTYYRVDPELMNRLNQLLSLYKGTHNFHNFTSGKQPNDNSSMRYIMEINCSQPFLYEEMEFAKIVIRGQSFMLHQIRKMVGLVFAIMRGYGEESKIEESFLELKQDIPIAPGLGLLLENVHYDTYNRKFTGNGMHEALIWDEFNDEIEEFKRKYIFNNVYHQEKKNYSMINWLETLKMHKNLFCKNSNLEEDVENVNSSEEKETKENNLFVIDSKSDQTEKNENILSVDEKLGPNESEDLKKESIECFKDEKISELNNKTANAVRLDELKPEENNEKKVEIQN